MFQAPELAYSLALSPKEWKIKISTILLLARYKTNPDLFVGILFLHSKYRLNHDPAILNRLCF